MIWLVGSKGMLGSEISKQLSEQNIDFVSTDLDVDITNLDSINMFIEKNSGIKYIINCAAYTAVDKAEDEKEKAFLINAEGPKNLAKASSRNDIRLIHISTDYVFPGNDTNPRKEDDLTGPVSVYGDSKLQGEKYVSEEMDEYFIIRTAWLYGVFGANFVYTMLKLMNSRDRITVVDDQIGSPTNAEGLASAIIYLITNGIENFGIYHYSDKGKISWHVFAEKIYEIGTASGLLNSDCEVNPCSSKQFKTKAVRPAYSLLSKDKIKRIGVNVLDWELSLEKFFIRKDFDIERIQ